MVETLLEHDLPHPPMTVLFTVGEEVGALGAPVSVDANDLGKPTMGFNIDGQKPSSLIIGAIGADRWEVDVHGQSAHAGLHPDGGISASLIAARAIQEVSKRGYFGKGEETSQGGHLERRHDARWRGHQPGDRSRLRSRGIAKPRPGVSRPRSPRRTERPSRTPPASVKNDRGKSGSVDFRAESDYRAFRMEEDSPPVLLAAKCARQMRLCVRRPHIANGGLDANYTNENGIPTVHTRRRPARGAPRSTSSSTSSSS